MATFKRCIRQSGSLECFAKSNQPLPPNLVLGGVSHETFSNGSALTDDPHHDRFFQARAVVVTFVLNNPRVIKEQQKYIAWEREVVKTISALIWQEQLRQWGETFEEEYPEEHVDLLKIAYSTEVCIFYL